MDDLIERLEKAERGSRTLDSDIAVVVGFRDWTEAEWEQCKLDPGMIEPSIPGVPCYTTSIDDALTLAQPPGHPLWTWTIRARISGGHEFYEAEITVPSREFRGIQRTPALALVIASLKARSSTQEPG